MRRYFLTRIAVLGSLLALAARDDANTIELVTAASTEHSAPAAEPDNDKASWFFVPREARILFW